MDRMVIGSGSTYEVGDTGGAASGTTSSNGSHSHGVTVESGGGHSHTVTVDGTTLTESQMPSHKHGIRGSNVTGSPNNRPVLDSSQNNLANEGAMDVTGGSETHTHTATTNSTGSHTHTASSASTGAHTHSVDTLSPYYALAFIIKL